MKTKQPLQKRFERFVIPEPNSGCWLWTGRVNDDGYGEIMDNHRKKKAHRISWMLYNGPIPPGIQVLHHCDDPPCVNPTHLFLGTPKENKRDSCQKKRHSFGECRPDAKLKDSDIESIRKDHRSYRRIAALWGVAYSTIAKVKNGKTWKHVPSTSTTPLTHSPIPHFPT